MLWLYSAIIVLFSYHLKIYFNMLRPLMKHGFVQYKASIRYHDISSSCLEYKIYIDWTILYPYKLTCNINYSPIFWLHTWSRDNSLLCALSQIKIFSNKNTISYSISYINWIACPVCLRNQQCCYDHNLNIAIFGALFKYHNSMAQLPVTGWGADVNWLIKLAGYATFGQVTIK